MNQFPVLSLNCQCFGAIFDKLVLFLNKLRQKNILLSVIIMLTRDLFGNDDKLALFQIKH